MLLPELRKQNRGQENDVHYLTPEASQLSSVPANNNPNFLDLINQSEILHREILQPTASITNLDDSVGNVELEQQMPCTIMLDDGELPERQRDPSPNNLQVYIQRFRDTQHRKQIQQRKEPRSSPKKIVLPTYEILPAVSEITYNADRKNQLSEERKLRNLRSFLRESLRKSFKKDGQNLFELANLSFSNNEPAGNDGTSPLLQSP